MDGPHEGPSETDGARLKTEPRRHLRQMGRPREGAIQENEKLRAPREGPSQKDDVEPHGWPGPHEGPSETDGARLAGAEVGNLRVRSSP
jgi:hypothetical protein